jgi:hypothetical protein
VDKFDVPPGLKVFICDVRDIAELHGATTEWASTLILSWALGVKI